MPTHEQGDIRNGVSEVASRAEVAGLTGEWLAAESSPVLDLAKYAAITDAEIVTDLQETEDELRHHRHVLNLAQRNVDEREVFIAFLHRLQYDRAASSSPDPGPPNTSPEEGQ